MNKYRALASLTMGNNTPFDRITGIVCDRDRGNFVSTGLQNCRVHQVFRDIECESVATRSHGYMPKAQTHQRHSLPFKTRDGDGQTARARRRGGVKDDTGDNRGVAAALGVIHSAEFVNDRQTGTWFSSPKKNDEHHPEM